MKKLLIPFIVIGLVSCLNAGTVDVVISGLNGQPITPVKEITINAGDTFSIEIDYNAPSFWFFWSLGADVYVDSGPAKFDVTQINWYSQCWFCDIQLAPEPYSNYLKLSSVASDIGTIPAGSFIVRNILVYNNNFIGDYRIKSLNNTSLPSGGTFETDGSDLYVCGLGGDIIVHVVYHPACWDCPGQPKGDTNGDGKNNAADYFNFQKAYGTGFNTHPHGTGVGQYNCCCDFNHDGKINATDKFILKKYFGQIYLGTCSNISCQ